MGETPQAIPSNQKHALWPNSCLWDYWFQVAIARHHALGTCWPGGRSAARTVRSASMAPPMIPPTVV